MVAVGLNLVIGFTGQFSFGSAGFMAIGAYASAIVTAHMASTWAQSSCQC
jgi:branched-chain amino acid transport system permease protein